MTRGISRSGPGNIDFNRLADRSGAHAELFGELQRADFLRDGFESSGNALRVDPPPHPCVHHHRIGAQQKQRLGRRVERVEPRPAHELVALQTRQREQPRLPQLGDRAHLGHRRRRVGPRTKEARGAGGVPQGGVDQRAVDPEHRVIGVNGKIDPKIRLQKQRCRQKALAVLLDHRGPVGRALCRLGQYRIKTRRQRAVVKPHRIIRLPRPQHINPLPRERFRPPAQWR